MSQGKEVELLAWTGDGPSAPTAKVVYCPDCCLGVAIKKSREGKSEPAICPRCQLRIT
ncbi:MAG: hypothetical protein PHU86_01330 [Patescibacteria group bacterium]|nr:hypothetical protein [Patescibacteria group bacterium]